MRPQGPTFFLLGGPLKEWRTAHISDVGIGEKTGLILAANAHGPYALNSADGSLGRVILPMGMARDEKGIIYLLGQAHPGVKRFDPETCAFVAMPGVGDRFGSEVGQFYEQFRDPANPLPSNIAVAGHNLYVADRGNRRVQVFARGTHSVRHVWGPRDGEGRRVAAQDECAWEPADVAEHDGRAYILDRRYSRVYVHVPGTDELRLLVEGKVESVWRRIAVDRDGRIYLLNSQTPKPQVEVFDRHGRVPKKISDRTKTEAADIRDRFEPPGIELQYFDEDDPPKSKRRQSLKFYLPEDLKSLCDTCNTERKRLTFKQPCENRSESAPAEPCRPEFRGELIFDREGERSEHARRPQTGKRIYAGRGEWQSEPLDSKTYRCQWHRIELDLYKLPPGTSVEVYTYTDAQELSADEAAQLLRKAETGDEDPEQQQRLERPEGEDEEERQQRDHPKPAYRVSGQLDPPRAAGEHGDASSVGCKPGAKTQATSEPGGTCAGSQNRHEFMIQSREGQYLYLKLVLKSDGFDTPAIRSVRVHYPRSSYLEYLPAVYSADDESRSFLERFLSIVQTEWDDLEKCIRDVAALFDPKAVPAGQALEYLASWFALPLEGAWNADQKRRLLEGIGKIYFGSWKLTKGKTVCLTEVNPAGAARRGTLQGLRRYLQIYLQNITGVDSIEQGNFPQIEEGFRERQRLVLSLGTTSLLSRGAPLWSPSAVGRLHLGSYARADEARLVSTGDPEHEIFQEYAHRFRVFVPSCWVRTATDEEMIHRALREEKPAHTSYDLCLVEARFRVGLQSTVGIDTILGAWPRARLACTHDTNIPPSRLPRQCLGLDTVLAGRPGDRPTMQIGPKTRAGIDTLLN